MGRNPLSPDGPSKPFNVRLSPQEDVVLTELEKATGYTRSQLLRLAVRALPMLASGKANTRTAEDFQKVVRASAFHQMLHDVELQDTTPFQPNAASFEHYSSQEQRWINGKFRAITASIDLDEDE